MKAIIINKTKLVYNSKRNGYNTQVTLAISHKPNEVVIFSRKFGKTFTKREEKGKTVISFIVENVERIDWYLKENCLVKKLSV